MKTIAILILSAVGLLAAIEYGPEPTISDDLHYFLLDDDGQVEREVSRDDFCHGDRLMVVEVVDGDIREAYMCLMVVEFPNTISMREFLPLTPEQALGILSR
jgi:hypothetical protein